jgi:TP901 family phage tail tape measure protein
VAVSNVELRVSATQAITALKKVDIQAKKFNQTVNGTNSKLKDANRGLPILGKSFFGAGKGASAASLSFKAAAASLGTLLLPLTAGITAVAAFGKVFSTLAAQDFASAKVKTLGVDVDNLTPKLSTLSNELSGQVSQLELLQASYDVASAGFGEVAELTDVLKASQLGATGGFSDLATVTDATTSVLNAYGLESDKAAKIVDGFVQTQNDGKIIVEQYAQQIGRLAPIAAGAGVGIDELNAAISSVTATGVPVESTFAGLRQVIASIQKPTSEAAKAAEKLGIDFSATALKTKGLGGVLQEVVDKGGASEETLALLFGSVEARTAVLPLLNDQLVSFNQNLKNQADAQGTAARAAFTASNTIQGQLTRLGTAFVNLAGEGTEFGAIIRETLKVAAVTVEGLGTAFKLILAPVRAIFAAVGEVGKAIAEAIGIDATNVVFDLEQSWIAVKEGVTGFSNAIVNVGKTVGTIVGRIVQAVIGTFQQIINFIDNQPVLKFIFGTLKLPVLDLKFKTNLESVEVLKNGIIETETATKGIETSVTTTNETIPKVTEGVDKLKDKLDESKDATDGIANQFTQIGESIGTGITDALVGAINGTKSLGDAARNILNDISNSLLRMGINTLLGGILPAPISNFLGFANGGRPPVGRPSIVGEKGPELFVPSTAGTIIPNDKVGGSTNNIVVNVDASGSNVEGDEGSARELGRLIGIAVQSEIVAQQRPGGLLA